MLHKLRVFVILVFGGFCACAAPRRHVDKPLPSDVDLRYTFELVLQPNYCVRVHVDALGDAIGETTFSVPDNWGGVDHPERRIRNVRLSDPAHDEIALWKPTANEWRAKHAPRAELSLSYELFSDQTKIEDSSDSYYRPIVMPGLFHLLGTTGLLAPTHLRSDAARKIEIRWEGFEEAGWEIVSSFGPTGATARVQLAIDDVRHSLFLAGKIRVHRVAVRGGVLCIAIVGDEWEFSDAAFIDLTRKVVEAERGFFQDYAYPHYLISLIPVGVKESRTHSLGGTGLTHSFALFMGPNTKLIDPNGRLGVRHLLAHELFHHWNGRVIGRTEPEELFYWFSEGFTEFYARRLLLRAGLISDVEYIEDLNASISAYMNSPVRNEPATRILADFWKNRDVEKLPYRRGDMIALMLDYEIRRASEGKRSLDDFMMDLCARARGSESSFDTESIAKIIESYTSREVADRVRRIGNDGETVVLPAETLEPCATMVIENPQPGKDAHVPKFYLKPGVGGDCRGGIF